MADSINTAYRHPIVAGETESSGHASLWALALMWTGTLHLVESLLLSYAWCTDS